MTALLSGTHAVRTSGALVLAGAVLSGPIAMLVVARMSPQPAWTGVSACADHYHPVQLLLLTANGMLSIGDIGLYLSEDGHSGEVGFTLQPSAQGHGLASRAVREALQLFFSTTTVARVLGITDERNLPSIRLLDRLGFEHIETRHVVFRDEPCTERVYALSRSAAISSAELTRP